MKITINKPIFSGEYVTPDEIDQLKKFICISKETPNFPSKYYIVVCFMRKNKFWQEAYTTPKYDAESKFFKGLEILNKTRNADEAWELFKTNFRLEKNLYKGSTGRWKKFEYIMARSSIPESYRDSIKFVYAT